MRKIHEIAKDIRKAWPKPTFSAVPYLNAMGSLTTVNDSFGCDSSKSIILYFLSNAASFRGEEARVLKQELKELIR